MTKIALLAALSMYASFAFAQMSTSGDWTIVSAEDGSGDVVAGTFTESGAEILSYRCYASTGMCSYGLMPSIDCINGSNYPVLVNAAAGAALVTATCFKPVGKAQYSLQPYKPIEDAINGGTGMIGFAFPMASGAFKAVRFSVLGGSAAIKAAEALIVQRRRSNGSDNPSRPRVTTF
jgi:hypothetical protein